MDTTDCVIRWIVRGDMPDVERIDEMSFSEPWSRDEFTSILERRTCIGMVALIGDKIVGFVVYGLRSGSLFLLRLAVDPEFRRRGIGGSIITRMKDKLPQQNRESIGMRIKANDPDSNSFLRSQGFRCARIIRHASPRVDDLLFVYHRCAQ